MTLLAIINPEAGRQTGLRTWRRLRSEAAGITRDWECVTTRCRGHATALARAAATTRRYERVLSSAATVPSRRSRPGWRIPRPHLASFRSGPAMTPRAISRSRATQSCCRLAARIPARYRPGQRRDIREVAASTSFVNVAGSASMPRLRGGSTAFASDRRHAAVSPVGTLQTLWQYAAPACVSVSTRGHRAAAVHARGRQLRCLRRGMRIAPTARPDDGAFDVCLVHALPRLEVLRMIPRLYSGGHVSHPSVSWFAVGRSRPSPQPESRTPRICHADDEQVGGLPACFAFGRPHCSVWRDRCQAQDLSAQTPRISATGPTRK